MSKIRSIFQKMCSVAVILYFAYFLFFMNVKEEIISFFRECWRFFWIIVNGSPASILLFSFLVFIIMIGFINWILDDTKKRKKKKEKEGKEEKIQEALQS